ncbi:MAG: ABC transporter permease [Deltaproteobacteria bacterium]|nr:ABC transporter permease [Deltaproteobacteria bacterium]MBF0523513.1 ABC transporter permease [Deltaproteobacteria bacterium]
MSNISAIFWREFKAYFNSPIAYIVIPLFLIITGWFFSSSLFLMNQASLRQMFSVIPAIFIFFIPAVTMRLIAEEKKNGTFEILATLPTTDMEIVVGKFLSALCFVAVFLLLTFPQVVTVMALGDAELGPILGGYLGVLMMAAAYLSIGLFASSLTDNQIIAFILAFVIAFAFFMVDKFLFMVPGPLVSMFEYLSMDYHFANVAKGIIDTRDLVYYFSIIFMGLFLTGQSLAGRKWG